MNAKSMVAFLSLALCCASIARAQTHEWTRQLGTSSLDASYGVSADGLGNVYISGATRGSLGGANAGYADAFLAGVYGEDAAAAGLACHPILSPGASELCPVRALMPR